MDRSILEGDPHSVIEGLAIAALAVGAAEGFMYIRDEYELALKNMRKALETDREAGFWGKISLIQAGILTYRRYAAAALLSAASHRH
jgi:NADH:ubiquinone oxidoreductase subunit F (NADH-binding)